MAADVFVRQRGAHPIDSNIRGGVLSTRDIPNDAVESYRILPTKNGDDIKAVDSINGNTHVDEAIDVQADECTVA